MKHSPIMRPLPRLLAVGIVLLCSLALATCGPAPPACPDCPACSCNCPDPVVGLEGTTNLDTLALGSNLTVAGTASVTGAASFGSTLTASTSVTSADLTASDDVTVGDKILVDDIDEFTANNDIFFLQPTHAYIDATAVTTNTNLAANDRGELYTNQGAAGEITLTLPAAADGLNFCVYVYAAQNLNVDVQTGDQIHHLTDSAGDKIQNTGTIGDSVCLVGVDGTFWVPVHETGTWSDAN